MAQKRNSTSHHTRKNVLVKNKSNSKISQTLIISESSLMRTKSGSAIHKNDFSKKRPKDDLCTHCGVRQKGPGFRFLCRYCFRKAGDEAVYSINSGATNKDIFSQKVPW